MDNEDKILLLVMAVIFMVVFVAGAIQYYPHPKEPIVVGIDGQWPVGSYDFETTESNIPLLDFECNGINYTTYDDGDGWFVKPIRISPERIKKNVDDETTFQKFLLGGGSTSENPDTLFVMYVVIIDDNVRYSIEEVYSADKYKLSFEQKGNQVVVSHHPLTNNFLGGRAFASLIASLFGGMIIGGAVLIVKRIKRRS